MQWGKAASKTNVLFFFLISSKLLFITSVDEMKLKCNLLHIVNRCMLCLEEMLNRIELAANWL